MDTDPRTESSASRVTLFYTLFLVACTVVYRLVPHYLLDQGSAFLWHLMPFGALGLFAGSRLRTRTAFLVPLVAMFATDLMVIPALAARGYAAFYAGSVFVYLGFAGYVLVGRLVAGQERSPAVIGGTALLGSVQFFLVTNFGSWLTDSTYTKDLAGLLTSYAAGIPFYRPTLASDLVFTVLFFGLHAAVLWATSPRTEKVPA